MAVYRERLRDLLSQVSQEMSASGRLFYALEDLRRGVERLTVRFSWAAHKRMTDAGHTTAADWLKKNYPKKASPAAAASLTRRTKLYCRHDGPSPYDGVYEFTSGRRVITYFNTRSLELVFKYDWRPETAKVAEAQMDLLEFSNPHEPLRPPPKGKS